MFNTDVTSAADAVIADAIAHTLANLSNQGALATLGPAGAGKSTFIVRSVEAVRAAEARVVVASPTNEQAFDLTKDIAERLSHEVVTLYISQRRRSEVPAAMPTNVRVTTDFGTANQASIVVGTLNKLGDAHARGNLGHFDLLLMDEAYQANSTHYLTVGGLAPHHLLVGDPGQLSPFTTIADGDRYRGLAEDPLQTAVDVLRRHHPTTPVLRLPITRRLDPRAVPVVRAFYGDHEFESAVLAGVRQLALTSPSTTSTHSYIDAALEHGAVHGWAHVELPAGHVVSADPDTIDTITHLVQRLLARNPVGRCERHPHGRAVTQRDIAIAVSHNDQRNYLLWQLGQMGLNQVVVDTANKLQGRTFEVMVAWHPLAGQMEADAFHVEAGRLCVMMTRHRQACFVVGRAADRELLEGPPPSAPAYLGCGEEPILDGWQIHRQVFAKLAPHRIAA
ncbi:ATP-binding protein [Nodosilinea sp. LEGE 07298]|uniref:AAA family ATPase n=1 Tax=Nodosilinea sp. LEGE 07298 TaxID=2777970 RepID=UPI001881E988|nr:AAA family ATPase [Nodosilinea sp. LEGE 07298]MBE9112117.1 ATP-binding protein [Nodosilinea sp. LEGE 07298]